MKKIIYVFLVLLIFWLCYHFFIFPWLMRWGATAEEYLDPRPGDELVQQIWYKNTLAVTVEAPPSAIWPWINQIGLDKGGFYTYTWLENMFGCDLHNADRIHPEWQNTKAGDYEPVCRSASRRGQPGWVVAIVEAPKTLIWRGDNNVPWMLGIYVDSLDSNHSRLITRMQFEEPKELFNWWLEKLWWEWAHSIMQHGVIHGIKQRVENSPSTFTTTRSSACVAPKLQSIQTKNLR